MYREKIGTARSDLDKTEWRRNLCSASVDREVLGWAVPRILQVYDDLPGWLRAVSILDECHSPYADNGTLFMLHLLQLSLSSAGGRLERTSLFLISFSWPVAASASRRT